MNWKRWGRQSAVVAGLTLMAVVVFADTTITCVTGNPTLQDTPLTALISEDTCNEDVACLTSVRQQNAAITTQNTTITAHNTVLAGYRAQCDSLLAAQAQTAAAAKAQQEAQLLQNLAKALSSGSGSGSDNKKNGSNNSGLDTGKDDGQGKANDAAKSSIESSAQKIATLSTNGSAVTSALQKYVKARSSCVSDQSTAASSCNSQNSSVVSGGTSTVDSTGASGTVSANKASLLAGNVDQTGADTLSGFIADCTPKNDSCKESCGSATTALDELKSAVDSAQAKDSSQQAQLTSEKSKINSGIQQEKNASDKTSVAGKEKTCSDKNAKTLASAADGLGKMLQALGTALAANAGTAATTAPTISTTTDCTDATQAQTPTCICAANPRAPGCTSESTSSEAASMAAVGDASATTAGTATTLPSASNEMQLSALQSRESSSGVGGSSGTGAPLGGGSGFGGSAAAASPEVKRSLDTNVIGVAGSGGSGGGGWAKGESPNAAKYREYLPGGKRDPASAAALVEGTKEVSSSGGKSNWEKVSERYRDANATLITGQ